MKVPLRWLQDYVELPSNQKVLTDRLTAIGHMQDHPPVELAGTTVLDLEVRQNRSDCLSMLGLAREVSAATDRPLQLPPSTAHIELGQVTNELVRIAPNTACYRFHAVRLDNLKVAASPAWLVQRLQAYGIKAINNVVDITNFVMVELGEPLHAFDRSRLHGALQIRQAKAGESFTMLGERTIKLQPADIVVADDQQVVSLAGMIGGFDSGVSETTTSIILEAATYNQAHIRRSSLRHSLRTEASLRHEKFLHTSLPEVALRRAIDLLQTIAGAKVVSQTDVITKNEALPRLSLRLARLNMLSGISFTLAMAVPILQRLGFEIIDQDSESLIVQVPYFRTDVTQEEDVIEEVLRIYGYDQIPSRLPSAAVPRDLTSATYLLEEQIRDILVGFGFDEQISEPLTKETHPKLEPVKLQNSLNSEKTMLRTTLQLGLVAAMEYQQKFRKSSIAVFELGRIYFKTDKGTYTETPQLAVLMAGPQVTLAKLKGIWEGLIIRLGCQPSTTPSFTMLDKQVGYFEIDLSQLLSAEKNKTSHLRTTVPQVVYEDLSLVAPIDVKVGSVMQVIRQISSDMYRVELGESPRRLNDTQKSLFLKLQYHSTEGQIATAAVQYLRQQVLKILKDQFKIELR